MANLGAVGTSYTTTFYSVGGTAVLAYPLFYANILNPPWWGVRPISASTPLPTWELRGKVTQRVDTDDVPLDLVVVRLYYRPGGILIAWTITDAAGEFVFSNLMPESGGYYAVAMAPDGTPLQNALIYDRLTPVEPAP